MDMSTLITGLLESYLISNEILPADTISQSTRLEETLIQANSLPGLSQGVDFMSQA
jgi:hypothetical protein